VFMGFMHINHMYYIAPRSRLEDGFVCMRICAYVCLLMYRTNAHASCVNSSNEFSGKFVYTLLERICNRGDGTKRIND